MLKLTMQTIIDNMKLNNQTANMKMIKSPLRICPLGAHVDHQGGLVTGMALDVSIDLAYTANDDGYVDLQSLDFPDKEYFHIDHVPDMIPGFWGNYIRGAVLALSQSHKLTKGIKAYVSGKIPIGGLSSSAAVTTAYLMALCEVNKIEASKSDLIQYNHWVERHFIGLQSGLLDQSANILSLDRHLMYLDCRSGVHQMIEAPANMPKFEVVIAYSGISTPLMGTDYNHRVDECKVAAWLLQEMAQNEVSSLKDVRLSDIDIDTYERFKDQLPGRFGRRAEHYFAENERVKEGIGHWQRGDLVAFGQLMTASGRSSIHNYECGNDELTTLYNLLVESPGVYGARFSGAGYRGCCIGLIDPSYRKEIEQHIVAVYPVRHPEYKDRFRVFFCGTDDGARVIEEWA